MACLQIFFAPIEDIGIAAVGNLQPLVAVGHGIKSQNIQLFQVGKAGVHFLIVKRAGKTVAKRGARRRSFLAIGLTVKVAHRA